MKIYNELEYSDDFTVCLRAENTFIKEVTLHPDTKKIGDNAFALCKHIQKINFNENLEVIGESAFGLLNMKKLDLSGTNLKIIDKCAFFGAELKELILPDSLIEIKDAAFANTHIEKMNFPKSLEKLGKKILLHNMEIKNIDLKNTNITHLEIDTFVNVFNVENLILPKNLKTLDYMALSKSKIKNLFIPSSLETFGSFVFSTSIENVYYDGSSKKVIDYLELEKKAKTIKNYYLDNLETLIKRGKSFKDINKVYKDKENEQNIQ